MKAKIWGRAHSISATWEFSLLVFFCKYVMRGTWELSVKFACTSRTTQTRTRPRNTISRLTITFFQPPITEIALAAPAMLQDLSLAQEDIGGYVAPSSFMAQASLCPNCSFKIVPQLILGTCSCLSYIFKITDHCTCCFLLEELSKTSKNTTLMFDSKRTSAVTGGTQARKHLQQAAVARIESGHDANIFVSSPGPSGRWR